MFSASGNKQHIDYFPATTKKISPSFLVRLQKINFRFCTSSKFLEIHISIFIRHRYIKNLHIDSDFKAKLIQ